MFLVAGFWALVSGLWALSGAEVLVLPNRILSDK